MLTKKLTATLMMSAGLLLPAHAAEGVSGYTLEEVVPGSAFHGIHGITFTSDNRILAGSVLGRAIYEIDPETGDTSIFIDAPEGMADDLEEGPNGELGWTAFLEGKYYLRTAQGETLTLAEGLSGLNSTAWSPDGRLFTTQVFLGDALYELDPAGNAPPRKIMENMGGLNGFDFGPDGKLYGPLWFKGQVAKVDVDTAELEIIADGFDVPAAVNFDSKGNLWVVDTARGDVVRVDVATGEKTVVASVNPSIDNLAISATDELVITNMADNAVIRINTETGESTPLTSGALAVAADLAMVTGEDGKETLLIGDLFSFRALDIASGDVSEVGRVFGSNIDYPISVGANGTDIALAGWSAGMVQRYDMESGELGEIHHNFTTPLDALPLPGGDTLVSEYARGALVRVDGSDWSKRTDVATELAGPSTLLALENGNVLVSENLSGTISEINLETGEKTVIVEGLAGPEGFDQGADGTLYVAEVGAKQISLITASGEKSVIGTDLPIGFAGPEDGLPIYVPTGLAVSAAGDVYFASDMEAAIYKLKRQ
ncbi:MAG: PQQ-binding-like beta-propeller repeat protein [Rhodobiaceae bacterium]|nr:PQQ-binding-like beta-propeller repeat protein [Rhodobiaceae bacterium]